ncbi:UNVERIFIED_CONTAM: hypothetical protein Slati_3451500 [Sesamum latifolium]|uniref:Uncharacterized protein n=1 Tax=Sesamum latifolium TaxID=2727402 RepID=A0AAW2UFP3_9LAMI
MEIMESPVANSFEALPLAIEAPPTMGLQSTGIGGRPSIELPRVSAPTTPLEGENSPAGNQSLVHVGMGTTVAVETSRKYHPRLTRYSFPGHYNQYTISTWEHPHLYACIIMRRYTNF